MTAPPQPEHLKFVFFMRSAGGYLRFFESVIRLLLERGHAVHLVTDAAQREQAHNAASLGSLQEKFSQLTWSRRSDLLQGRWSRVGRRIRLERDYLQVLAPEFRSAPALVARAEGRVGWLFAAVMRMPPFRGVAFRRVAGRTLALAEAALPRDAALERFLDAERPDAVLLTPHLMPGSRHSEYLRSADALDIPTAVLVASWDNLSSKQVIHSLPDLVAVWNEVQREEAMELHGIPSDRIVVTGAQCFDHWFDSEATPRASFCERIGLPADKPYVLYTGGALFPSEIGEHDFVRRWLNRLRESADADVRNVAVLIRPHPKRAREWRSLDLDEPDVVIWPQEVTMPVSTSDRQDYYDSLAHSAAVVGVNTSAMIEASIVGKPVHTVLVPEFSASQEGTFHFRYLTASETGLLIVARSLDEHVAQLGESIRGRATQKDEAFVASFVRPLGRDVAATPVLVDAIERLPGARRDGPVASREPWWVFLVRATLLPFVAASLVFVAWRAALARVRGRASGTPLESRVQSATGRGQQHDDNAANPSRSREGKGAAYGEVEDTDHADRQRHEVHSQSW